MTHKDILRMAREAGIGPVYGNDSIERFAALVAAHEREACAQACEAMNAKCDFAGPAVFARVIRARGNS